MRPYSHDCSAASPFDTARRQIEHNLALLRPGFSFEEFNAKSWRVPPAHIDNCYSFALHGVGLADEWHALPLHMDFDETVMSGRFEHGIVICVESLIGESGSVSVKLETQVLITEGGHDRLDGFPWENEE